MPRMLRNIRQLGEDSKLFILVGGIGLCGLLIGSYMLACLTGKEAPLSSRRLYGEDRRTRTGGGGFAAAGGERPS